MRHTTTTTTTSEHEFQVSREELISMLRRSGISELSGLNATQIVILDATTHVPVDEGLVIRYEIANTAGSAEEVHVET